MPEPGPRQQLCSEPPSAAQFRSFPRSCRRSRRRGSALPSLLPPQPGRLRYSRRVPAVTGRLALTPELQGGRLCCKQAPARYINIIYPTVRTPSCCCAFPRRCLPASCCPGPCRQLNRSPQRRYLQRAPANLNSSGPARPSGKCLSLATARGSGSACREGPEQPNGTAGPAAPRPRVRQGSGPAPPAVTRLPPQARRCGPERNAPRMLPPRASSGRSRAGTEGAPGRAADHPVPGRCLTE